jgi:hypothetical protein
MLRVSYVSLLLANDKGDNEVKPEAVHRVSGIQPTVEENWTISSRRQSFEAVRPVIAQMGSLTLNNIGRISKHSREKIIDHGLRQKKEKNLKLPWRCHQLLPGHLVKDPLPRVIIMGLAIDLLALAYIRAKLQASGRRQSIKTMRLVIASNGVPYLQVRSVGSHSVPGREKEG